MPLDAYHQSDPKPAEHANSFFCDAVTEFLAPMRGKAGIFRYSSAARHFLFWLDQNRTQLSSVNASTVRRFANHACSCPRYSAVQLRDPYYINVVRRFVRFLEDRGDIRRADEVHDINQHLARYADRLTHLGYGSWAHRVLFSAAEHFALWLRVSRLRWADVDDALIERFARHNCCCGLRRKNGKLAVSGLQKRRRGAQRFLSFLREGGMVPACRAIDDSPEVGDTRLIAYRIWLERHCGMTGNTVERYLYEVARWQADLGDDPASYEVTALRNIMLNQPATRSRSSIRLTATVLRSYLRFLAARNECRPELCHAVPSVARRRLSNLPRYVSEATVERIIASCGKATSADLRDRAIILLLARLGLRAGDICRLRFSDIDWANALIRVHGKGRRSANLPLPQDAGDALLAYIEQARPLVAEERIFLRLQAPFTPLASSSQISDILSRVLARGGIEGVPTGAHLFRHSLATRLLRNGAGLETVGTVLRHRSPSTTAIYAKVDVPMLKQIAQPWPGDVSC
ncbi:tyrosine-type recombinase/integrase (plasmid) [Rhizobium sp. CB3090]|uniref:tyrosine-type recombinase/integrase n=1 Tax=Rhizobium sp. CB3090 TaxID=3039156 RepID=UPI0024B1A464|nr:tyrosine-type recombinase/integrase [Rhizobium sp. CB3090]WFU13339.1 tyrosine-type recombinase/integrase [Rhizobium sp. CB3090]